MSPADLDLPSDPDELRAFAEVIKARLAASEQALAQEQKALAYERKAHDATRDELGAARNAIKLTTLQIEKLKAQLAKLRRMKFGQSSERMMQLADQLELTLEDLEAQQA
ncbi:transposase, partial [Erythrobacter donghaensis]